MKSLKSIDKEGVIVAYVGISGGRFSNSDIKKQVVETLEEKGLIHYCEKIFMHWGIEDCEAVRERVKNWKWGGVVVEDFIDSPEHRMNVIKLVHDENDLHILQELRDNFPSRESIKRMGNGIEDASKGSDAKKIVSSNVHGSAMGSSFFRSRIQEEVDVDGSAYDISIEKFTKD